MFGDSAPHRQENRANSVALRARRWTSGPRRSVRISRAPVSADLGAHGLDAGVDLSASWTSLRRMFDDVVDYMTDPVQAAGAAELQRVAAGGGPLHEALDRAMAAVGPLG